MRSVKFALMMQEVAPFSPYNLSLFKVSIPCEGLGTRFIFGAQEQLWSHALPDTNNDPDGIWTHNKLTTAQVLSTAPSII